MKILFFTDSEDFEDMILDAEVIVDDSVFTDSARSKNGVWIVATHSDIVINKRIYTSRAMKSGAHTFVKPFKKPVLVHHDNQKDAIGRVQESYYFHKEDWKAAERLVGKDLEFPDDASGAIVLRAAIPDKNAWEKVQDGRYESVSVGFSSESATCNICGKNWADGKCRHTPGKKYGNEVMYLIVEDMNFKEVSFINTPADSYAAAVATIENEDSEIEDTEVVLDNQDSCIEPDISKYKDSQEEKKMDFENAYNELLKEHNKLKTIYKKDASAKIFEIKANAKVKGFDAESKDEKIEKYMAMDIDTLELLKDELTSFSDGMTLTFEEMKKLLEEDYKKKVEEMEQERKEAAEASAKENEDSEEKPEENAAANNEDSETDKKEDVSEEPENKDTESEDEKTDEKPDTENLKDSNSNISITDPNGVISNTSSDRPSVTPKENALKQLGIKR